MKTYIFHLQTNNYEKAWEILDALESTPNHPFEFKDMEVGSGETEEKIVCGFSIDVKKEEDVHTVAYWLMDHGFGIPKIYQFS